MVKYYLLLVCMLFVYHTCTAQSDPTVDRRSATWGIKTNVLNNVYGSFNVGVEGRLQEKWTLDLDVHYNPIQFSEERGFKHFWVQPEIRYWWGKSFEGHFSGVYLMGGLYNVWGQEWLRLREDTRYQGHFWGAGLSYGYQYGLSSTFSVEGSVGLGVLRFHYDRIACIRCGTIAEDQKKWYVGPTKIAVSVIYKFP